MLQHQLKPDGILMDIVIPGGMDGTSAADIIMDSIGCAVVFVAGYGTEEIIQRAINGKPHGYLLKPFEPAEIKASIEIAFHKKQLEARLKKAYSDVLSELESKTELLEQKLSFEYISLTPKEIQMAYLIRDAQWLKITKTICK